MHHSDPTRIKLRLTQAGKAVVSASMTYFVPRGAAQISREPRVYIRGKYAHTRSRQKRSANLVSFIPPTATDPAPRHHVALWQVSAYQETTADP